MIPATIRSVKVFLGWSPLWRGLFLLAFVLLSLSLSDDSFGVTPDPSDANANTAEGTNALFSLTTGLNNTAIGFDALASLTTANANTGIGTSALRSLTTGATNTAVGCIALGINSIGNNNTAIGYGALCYNDLGNNNTASGYQALFQGNNGNNNTASGYQALYNNLVSNNTASGYQALYANTTGSDNTADGMSALAANKTGIENTASGFEALANNIGGKFNTASGSQALNRNKGTNNIAVGRQAGDKLTSGNNNIDIGHQGAAGEANTIHLGTNNTQTATFIAGISGVTASGTTVGVVINGNGQLGVATSSRRFKEDIRPMDQASDALLSLKPVTFRYKQDLDPEAVPQYGLIAEDVEKVNPNLVARDAEGKIFTVRYDAVNAMLLNEFLKEHQKVEDLGRKGREQAMTNALLKVAAAKQEATIAQQQKDLQAAVAQIEALAANLKEQASQLQKVSAQLETRSLTPQVAANHP